MLQRKKPLRRRTALKARKSLRRSHAPVNDAAARLWSVLREREVAGLTFRQREMIGPYRVDFVCPAARLVVLLAGSGTRDAEQAWLREHGYRVLMFDEAEVLSNPGNVLDAIARSFELRIVKS